jgi:signal transduction histidine kinase
MIFSQFIQDVALWLGIGFSLLWSTIFSHIYLVQKLELKTQDILMGIIPPPAVPPEILLVLIHQQDLKKKEWLEEPNFYAYLVNRLLEEGAAIVILNLRSNWLQTADHPDNPIKELVRNNSHRLVLVIPTTCAALPNPTKWRPYNYFIPLDPSEERLFPLKTVLGFSEYEPEEHEPSSLCSPSRRAHLVGKFMFSSNFNQPEELDAAVWLALKKFQRQQGQLKLAIKDSYSTPIQVYFWPQETQFPSLDVRTISNRSSSLKQVEQKIVLLGFADIDDPNSFSIHSPFGNTISNVEFQANFLGNLLINSFYRVTPYWLSNIILIGGGLVISKVIFRIMLQQQLKWWHWSQLIAGILGSLLIVVFFGFWHRLIFPAILALLTWGVTGLSVILCMLFGIRENLIQQQQGEIARLKSVEQEAIISQARKLLNRIYANVHDGPLQELKLIMDSLEILQIKHPHLNINPLLEQLESMGYHLRQQLQQTRNLSLQITPELREGLAMGIEKKLQELVRSEQLHLKVETNLQSLQEPVLNSLWLTAREEIFCFFCEAITNTIQHAQPPQGTATQLKVNLSQQGNKCTLTIENDGSPVDESLVTIPPYNRKKGGYGMKLMQNIASGLPQGSLKIVPLKNGGIKISLSWNFSFE